MPTKKPRITVTMEQKSYDIYDQLSKMQGRSKSSLIVEILEAIEEPMMRTVALLKAAQKAPKEVQQGLKNTIEELELELVGTVGKSVYQMDFLTTKLGVPTPVVVTRGSGLGKENKISSLAKSQKSGKNG